MTVPGMHGKFHDFEIAPDRFVYRAVATFSRPLSIKGNTWSSGTQTLYLDAATGRVLTSSTGGKLTESARPRIQPAHPGIGSAQGVVHPTEASQKPPG